MVQLSHPYMTTGKTIALTRWTFVCCVLVAQSCPTLWDPVDCRRLCPWDSPGKTTGVGCQGHSIICSSCLPGHRLHLVLPSLPNIDLQCCLFKAHDSLGALNKNGRNNFFKKSYCYFWLPCFFVVSWPFSGHGARDSHCGSFPCFKAQALEHGLSSRDTWAQLLSSMWDLPGPEIEPMSPSLPGRILTTGPPGKY